MESLGINTTLVAQLINFLIIFGVIIFFVRLIVRLGSLTRSLEKMSQDIASIRKLLEERQRGL